MSDRILVMDSEDFRRCISRMSYEILEKNRGAGEVALLGIQKKGVFMAGRLAEEINRIEHTDILQGSINISMYRDDYGTRTAKTIGPSNVPFSVDRKIIIIVDDVLYTGRSFRAAIDAIFDMGRPAAIQLAVMVDRGHRELPIQADFIGRQIPTSKAEQVEVVWSEEQGQDSVYIIK
jgi:pyrimidine operon attenuation protein/uracil phosphoribosyltransferase